MNDIEILEDFIKYFEAEAISRKYRRNISITVGEDDIEAIENLINRVKELEENNKKLQEGYDKRVSEILKLEQRIEELQEIEEEHRKENGKLREELKEIKEEYSAEQKHEMQNTIPKSKIKEVLEQRLKKYQDADDGKYKQDYLTRGEYELVDRYKECSELLKILCEEDIYKIDLDYIQKSKIKEKIEELEKECEECRFSGQICEEFLTNNQCTITKCKTILHDLLEE